MDKRPLFSEALVYHADVYFYLKVVVLSSVSVDLVVIWSKKVYYDSWGLEWHLYVNIHLRGRGPGTTDLRIFVFNSYYHGHSLGSCIVGYG